MERTATIAKQTVTTTTKIEQSYLTTIFACLALISFLVAQHSIGFLSWLETRRLKARERNSINNLKVAEGSP